MLLRYFTLLYKLIRDLAWDPSKKRYLSSGCMHAWSAAKHADLWGQMQWIRTRYSRRGKYPGFSQDLGVQSSFRRNQITIRKIAWIMHQCFWKHPLFLLPLVSIGRCNFQLPRVIFSILYSKRKERLGWPIFKHWRFACGCKRSIIGSHAVQYTKAK